MRTWLIEWLVGVIRAKVTCFYLRLQASALLAWYDRVAIRGKAARLMVGIVTTHPYDLLFV
jgi:hypothetical protein